VRARARAKRRGASLARAPIGILIGYPSRVEETKLRGRRVRKFTGSWPVPREFAGRRSARRRARSAREIALTLRQPARNARCRERGAFSPGWQFQQVPPGSSSRPLMPHTASISVILNVTMKSHRCPLLIDTLAKKSPSRVRRSSSWLYQRVREACENEYGHLPSAMHRVSLTTKLGGESPRATLQWTFQLNFKKPRTLRFRGLRCISLRAAARLSNELST